MIFSDTVNLRNLHNYKVGLGNIFYLGRGVLMSGCLDVIGGGGEGEGGSG